MKTYTITKKDLNENNEYIGKLNLEDLDGHLEAEENLGYVKVKSIVTKGYIYFKAGSGIEAGWCIKAGWGIEAGEGIKAGEGIEAGEGIKAGWGIEAGEGIKAGWGIEVGLSIVCKGLLKFSYSLFAGICYWRESTEEEMTITCGQIEGGTVKYGIVKELGIGDSDTKKKATELRKKADELLLQAKSLEESL